jgi:hypothetical protein
MVTSTMRVVTESEPPSRLSVFMIGQDSRGNWVVRDQSGLRGGLFVVRAQALRYVRDEAGNHSKAVVFVNGPFELDTSGMRRPPILHERIEEPRGRCAAQSAASRCIVRRSVRSLHSGLNCDARDNGCNFSKTVPPAMSAFGAKRTWHRV